MLSLLIANSPVEAPFEDLLATPFGSGILGGRGFTMSIFIALLRFPIRPPWLPGRNLPF
ncbi:hypothetical protein [Larkinella ripae]